MDRRAWQAAVHRVSQSQSWLKWLSIGVRDLFKKIRDARGTFHAKMGTMKDRNGIEAEGIKKRWQEYTEELCKKDLYDPDSHSGVITHLEPDILECEVKWALGSIATNKANGGGGIPVELFQILKDDAVKVLSIYQQIWKTQQWPQDWKKERSRVNSMGQSPKSKSPIFIHAFLFLFFIV